MVIAEVAMKPIAAIWHHPGTPPGVALGMNPPVWLQPGDVVELAMDGLGRQRQTVIPPR